MNLDQLLQNDPQAQSITNLLQRSRYWKQLDLKIKSLLPPNLHNHFQIACIENGHLIVFARSQMAANRLKMIFPSLLPQIQLMDQTIQHIHCRVRPQTEVKAEKKLKFSPTVLHQFEQQAQRLKHHPKLASALQNLVDKHR